MLHDRHKLPSSLVDESAQVVHLHMEGEVFQILVESHGSNHQLNEGMHQQHQFSLGSMGDCQGPQFDAVVELPTVHLLHLVLGGVRTHISQMQAHLADVKEAKLVGDLAVVGNEFNKAVLADDEFVLNVVGTSTELADSGEFIVHSLNSSFEKSLHCCRVFVLVALSREEVFEGNEGQDHARLIKGTGVVHH